MSRTYCTNPRCDATPSHKNCGHCGFNRAEAMLRKKIPLTLCEDGLYRKILPQRDGAQPKPEPTPEPKAKAATKAKAKAEPKPRAKKAEAEPEAPEKKKRGRKPKSEAPSE